MREIKFRAWDVRKKRMIYPCTFKRWGFINHEREPDASGCFGAGEILLSTDPRFYEWMQFTGLYDKDDKEIYEGDIVRAKGIKSIGDYVTTIEWEDGSIVLARNDTYFVDSKAWLVCTVIGNLYENPELVGAPHNKAGSLG